MFSYSLQEIITLGLVSISEFTRVLFIQAENTIIQSLVRTKQLHQDHMKSGPSYLSINGENTKQINQKLYVMDVDSSIQVINKKKKCYIKLDCLSKQSSHVSSSEYLVRSCFSLLILTIRLIFNVFCMNFYRPPERINHQSLSSVRVDLFSLTGLCSTDDPGQATTNSQMNDKLMTCQSMVCFSEQISVNPTWTRTVVVNLL